MDSATRAHQLARAERRELDGRRAGFVSSSIGFDRRDEIDGAQKRLADAPDAGDAEKQFDPLVHIAELQVISVRQHVDGDAHSLGDDELGARTVNRLDQPAAELPGVVQAEAVDAGRRTRLVEVKGCLDVNFFPSAMKASCTIGFPAGNRNARSSRSTLTSNCCLLSGSTCKFVMHHRSLVRLKTPTAAPLRSQSRSHSPAVGCGQPPRTHQERRIAPSAVPPCALFGRGHSQTSTHGSSLPWD